MRRSRLLLLVIMLGNLVVVTPSAYAAGERFFPETGQTVSGRFLEYWNQFGGLAIFGLPISPPFDERNADTGATYQVQYFERNRFEYHPQLTRPYDVLLGRLGVDSLERRGINWRSLPSGQAQPGCRFFRETQHSLCEPFLSYWQTRGGLAIFGLPLSEPQREASPTDGKTYLVQHFERNRFEAHPENQPPYHVLLGLLGSELYRPAPPPTIDAMLQQVVDLTNQERTRTGLGSVRVAPKLMEVAQSYSQEQAQQGRLSHTGVDGSSAGDRLTRGGYNWQTYGENLGAGYPTAAELMTAWMNSPGHRANILNPNFHEIGVGYTQRANDPANFGHYWVMMLGTPR